MKLVAEGHLWDISLGGQVAGGVRKYEKNEHMEGRTTMGQRPDLRLVQEMKTVSTSSLPPTSSPAFTMLEGVTPATWPVTDSKKSFHKEPEFPVIAKRDAGNPSL